MKGETDKQATTAAIGDTVIEEFSSAISGKTDKKLGMFPGASSAITDKKINNAKRSWNNMVEKYVY